MLDTQSLAGCAYNNNHINVSSNELWMMAAAEATIKSRLQHVHDSVSYPNGPKKYNKSITLECLCIMLSNLNDDMRHIVQHIHSLDVSLSHPITSNSVAMEYGLDGCIIHKLIAVTEASIIN